MIEKWAGHYVYDETYPQRNGQSVAFEVEWSIADGVINGTCTDDDTRHAFDKPSAIKGFLDGNIIDFTKQYPNNWTFDETGAIEMLDEPADPIDYSGLLVDDHFEGDWKVPLYFKLENGHMHEYLLTGTWVLYRK